MIFYQDLLLNFEKQCDICIYNKLLILSVDILNNSEGTFSKFRRLLTSHQLLGCGRTDCALMRNVQGFGQHSFKPTNGI